MSMWKCFVFRSHLIIDQRWLEMLTWAPSLASNLSRSVVMIRLVLCKIQILIGLHKKSGGINPCPLILVAQRFFFLLRVATRIDVYYNCNGAQNSYFAIIYTGCPDDGGTGRRGDKEPWDPGRGRNRGDQSKTIRWEFKRLYSILIYFKHLKPRKNPEKWFLTSLDFKIC